MKSHQTLKFASLLGTLLSIALFSILLAGCGTSTVGAAQSTPASTATTVQKCGTIGVMRTVASTKAPGATTASSAGSCFWQAFQQCRAASLTVNFGSVDTVTIHNFTLEKKNAGCTISDAVQNRVIPRAAKSVGTYTCSGLASGSNELHFNGCGTLGNIVVPTSQVANPQ